MGFVMKFFRRVFRWAALWAARSVWWPLAGKALAGAVAFVALAHVGTGAAQRLSEPAMSNGMSPARGFAVPIEPDPAVVAAATSRPSAAPSASCQPTKPAAASAWTADGKLILNLAAVTDLQKLPRIGEKRAGAIVELRKKLGRFKRVRDLLRIRGIGYRLLQKLKPLVVVDAPKAKE
jgi:competence protein ComEA